MSHQAHHEPTTAQEYHETLHEHDDWFRHSANEPHHQEAHGSTHAAIIIAFLFGTVVFVAISGALVYQLFQSMTDAVAVENHERRTPVDQFLSSKAEWERQLSQLTLIDGAPGRARVPLDMAQKLVIEDYTRNSGK